MAQRPVRALITDLDNTLWDWFAIWHASFGAMLNALAEKLEVSASDLLPEIKAVHQRHGTAEYAFLLEELPTVQRRFPRAKVGEEFAEVIAAHRDARRAATKLYPGVRETLERVRASGALILAYTESQEFYTQRRLRNTSLDDIIDVVYSPPDHDLPVGVTRDVARTLPAEHYQLRHTEHRLIPRGEKKPSERVLSSILSDAKLEPHECVYIGDSLVKDVWMAQRSGVPDVHASYGVSHKKEEYDLLVQVTHWTEDEVLRERATRPEHVTPTHTVAAFANLLDHFAFERHS